MERDTHGRREHGQIDATAESGDEAFTQALPLLCQILGIKLQEGAA
jgi:hypothetical protein